MQRSARAGTVANSDGRTADRGCGQRKIGAPQLFSRMYTAVRETPRLQGAPYVLCAVLVVAGHGLFGAAGDAGETKPPKQ